MTSIAPSQTGRNIYMKRNYDRQIILEDGQQFRGCSFGDTKDRILEIVFNTSMAGYQEILSDPSYTDQAVVMTYPLIGNYGMADEDYETDRPTIGALIVHEYNDEPSNFRSRASLGDVMKKYGISGISGVDTRRLNRSIRDFGTRKCLLTGIDTPLEEGVKILRAATLPRDAVRRGCDVTVVPWNTSAAAIRDMRPDGVLISNGPGDPTDVPETIETVRQLLGSCPVFGICLGHQILSLAYGARTYKLGFGHRGGNHPVKDLTTGRIEITSQNHSYAVDRDSLAGTPLAVTHVNILDGTIEGVECLKDSAFSVQYHPESAPGPQDSAYLFDRFIGWIQK